jgi:Tfp pilus assembly protein PilO
MKDFRLLPGLAAVAPFVILGFVYVLAVQPKLALERDAEARAASLRRELTRAHALTPPTPALHNAAQREFQERVSVEDRSSEVADALRRLLKNSTVGGAGNVSIETGDVVRPTSDALESRIKSFDGPIAYRPLTVTFDARPAQLRQFFSGLRTMPTIVELRGVEIAPAPSGTAMRTRLVLFVYQRSDAGAQAAAVPAPPPVPPLLADARPALEPVPKPTSPAAKPPVPKKGSSGPARSFEPDPVVHTILFSSQHKVALVDGRIVRVGDRLGSGRVLAIEQNAVVFVTAAGLVKRLVLEQPRIRASKQ